MNNVKILVISDSMDFTTDYVCLELNKRNCSYLRINRDKFSEYDISFDINNMKLYISIDSERFIVDNECLEAVYYRAPIYLHHIPKKDLSFDEQIYRSQWMAFIRNLTIFENIIWLNNPIDTFRGENKILQLKYAQNIGFDCPSTYLGNCLDMDTITSEKKYIMKSLDTVLLRNYEKEAFVYSTVMTGEEIMQSYLSLAPVIIQEYLYPKVDLRVTVVGKKTFPVKIVKNGHGIEGDWRKEKENVDFRKIDLPESVEMNCVKIVKELGLSFGGIDLILHNNKYYFIEVNPTGEWAWLVNRSGLEIDKAICDHLRGQRRNKQPACLAF